MLTQTDFSWVRATRPSVRAHLDDPRTLVIPHLYVLAWGRKPSA